MDSKAVSLYLDFLITSASQLKQPFCMFKLYRYFNPILIKWQYVDRESYLQHLVVIRGVCERITSFFNKLRECTWNVVRLELEDFDIDKLVKRYAKNKNVSTTDYFKLEKLDLGNLYFNYLHRINRGTDMEPENRTYPLWYIGQD